MPHKRHYAQRLEVRGLAQEQGSQEWEEQRPLVTTVRANFREGRLAEVHLPKTLRHQGRCTVLCTSPALDRDSALSGSSSASSGDSCDSLRAASCRCSSSRSSSAFSRRRRSSSSSRNAWRRSSSSVDCARSVSSRRTLSSAASSARLSSLADISRTTSAILSAGPKSRSVSGTPSSIVRDARKAWRLSTEINHSRRTPSPWGLASSLPWSMYLRMVRGLTRTAFAATSVVTHPDSSDKSALYVRECPRVWSSPTRKILDH